MTFWQVGHYQQFIHVLERNVQNNTNNKQRQNKIRNRKAVQTSMFVRSYREIEMKYQPKNGTLPFRTLAYTFMYASFASILSARTPAPVPSMGADIAAQQRAENNAIRANFLAGILYGILFAIACAIDALKAIAGFALVSISFLNSHRKWVLLALIPASCMCCTLTLSSTFRHWTAQLNQSLESQGVQFSTPIATIQPDILVRAQETLRSNEILALTLAELQAERVDTTAGRRDFSMDADVRVYLQRNWWQICQYEESDCVITNGALTDYAKQHNMLYLPEQ